MGLISLFPTLKTQVGQGGEVATKTPPHHPYTPFRGVRGGGGGVCHSFKVEKYAPRNSYQLPAFCDRMEGRTGKNPFGKIGGIRIKFKQENTK